MNNQIVYKIILKIKKLFVSDNSYSPEKSEPMRIVMGVVDFCSGGLERVVIDLCVSLKVHQISSVILVANKEGKIAYAARDLGVEVETFNGDVKAFDKRIVEINPHIYMIHHCYHGIEVAASCHIPVIEVIHNTYFWQKQNEKYSILRNTCIEHFIAVSKTAASYSIKHLNVVPERVTIISNGLSNDTIIRPTLAMRKKNRLDTYLNRFVFIHIANFFPVKRHVLIVKSFALFLKYYPNSHLTLVGGSGSDHYEIKVKALVQELGISNNVTFTGYLDHRQVSIECAHSHVGLLPSLIEGFSIALLEYLYFGLPVIVTDVGGAGDVFGESLLGKLLKTPVLNDEKDNDILSVCDYSDVEIEELLNAMLCSRDNYLEWFGYGENAINHVEKFSMIETASKYVELVNNIVR